MNSITCAEFEILLADYLDGTLGTGEMTAVESHRDSCCKYSRVPSVEKSSTMINSISMATAATRRMISSIVALSLYAGITTDSSGEPRFRVITAELMR